MKIEIKLFALAKQLIGSDHLQVELADGATIRQLRSALAEQHPELSEISSQLMFAIDADYADDSTVVHAGADVACIPPVSGG